MDTPDDPKIELGRVCDRASLVYCLELMYNKAGRPSYRTMWTRTGGRLARATISDLIGPKSRASTRKTTWATVELFIEACQVPVDLDEWHAAWERSVATGRPAWMNDLDQLTAENAQLKASAAEAKRARVVAEEQLTAAQANIQHLNAQIARCGTVPELPFAQMSGSPPVVPALADPIHSLRVRADTYHEAHSNGQAAKLYKQLAKRLQRKHGPNDAQTFGAWLSYLHSKTEACIDVPNVGVRHWIQRKRADIGWQRRISKWPVGSHANVELRREYAWVLRRISGPSDSYDTSPARKVLIDLLADCKTHLPPGDVLTTIVDSELNSEQLMRRSILERNAATTAIPGSSLDPFALPPWLGNSPLIDSQPASSA